MRFHYNQELQKKCSGAQRYTSNVILHESLRGAGVFENRTGSLRGEGQRLSDRRRTPTVACPTVDS